MKKPNLCFDSFHSLTILSEVEGLHCRARSFVRRYSHGASAVSSLKLRILGFLMRL